VRAADPDREIVELSGDYDFQFLIEEPRSARNSIFPTSMWS
jgi:glyoxylate carboligase